MFIPFILGGPLISQTDDRGMCVLLHRDGGGEGGKRDRLIVVLIDLLSVTLSPPVSLFWGLQLPVLFVLYSQRVHTTVSVQQVYLQLGLMFRMGIEGEEVEGG